MLMTVYAMIASQMPLSGDIDHFLNESSPINHYQPLSVAELTTATFN